MWKFENNGIGNSAGAEAWRGDNPAGYGSELAWRRRRRTRRALGIFFTLLAIPAVLWALLLVAMSSCCGSSQPSPDMSGPLVLAILAVATPVSLTTYLNFRDRNPAHRNETNRSV
jgi:hypothetical protein